MTTDTRVEDHLGAEDVFFYVERRLSRARRREVESHLDACAECLHYLAQVTRASAADRAENGRATGDHPGPSPAELLERLRPRIIATSPASGRGRRSLGTRLAAFAAAGSALILILVLIQTQLIAPAQARRLAARALANLVELREETGRVPLRYIPELHRARVTRSSFDAPDPREEELETPFRRAVQLAPAEKEARLALGLFLLDKGDLAGAEAELRQAIAIDPELVPALNALAVVLYERAARDPQRASAILGQGLGILENARALDPEDLQVAFNLGAFYEELGRWAEARQAWRRYLERDPSSEWAEVALENLNLLEAR